MVAVGLTASMFGLGATLSNFFGQIVVERYGHVTSLMGSFFISLIPICVFAFMPETLGKRTHLHIKASPPASPPASPQQEEEISSIYRSMA